MGAGNTEHFAEVGTRGGADAVLAASTFHGKVRVADLKQHFTNAGNPGADVNCALRLRRLLKG